MDVGQFRKLLGQIFGSESASRRRQLVSNWHAPYDRYEKHARLLDVFQEFITMLLYEKPVLRLRNDRLCFYGKEMRLSVFFSWLTEEERVQIHSNVIANKHLYFKEHTEFLHGQFYLETFLYDGDENLHDFTWGRALVREFCIVVHAQQNDFIRYELMGALQMLSRFHQQGRSDAFLVRVLNGLMLPHQLPSVLCWQCGKCDTHHPEEIRQNMLFANHVWEPPNKKPLIY